MFKHLQSTTPVAAIVGSSGLCIPNANAHVHTQVKPFLISIRCMKKKK